MNTIQGFNVTLLRLETGILFNACNHLNLQEVQRLDITSLFLNYALYWCCTCKIMIFSVYTKDKNCYRNSHYSTKHNSSASTCQLGHLILPVSLQTPKTHRCPEVDLNCDKSNRIYKAILYKHIGSVYTKNESHNTM